jgi:uncharacterized protein (TIGR00290 family)
LEWGQRFLLALWRSQKLGHNIAYLLTALDESGVKARSHGVSKSLIIRQGNALGIHNEFIVASWQDYEAEFIQKLKSLRIQNIHYAIFGDIDLLAHREWEEMVCAQASITAHLPLWGENRLDMAHEFLDAGFKARVVCVDGRVLNNSFVGREFNYEFISSLPLGVDACGENGEFHTFVYDGPNFNHPVIWKSLGKKTYTSPKEYGSQTFYFDLLDVG